MNCKRIRQITGLLLTGCLFIAGLSQSPYVRAEESFEREGLGHTLESCGYLNESRYTEESWQELQKAREDAEKVYDSRLGSQKCLRQQGKVLLAKSRLVYASAKKPIKTTNGFRELTGDEMVTQMGNGWNLGNTMDGHINLIPSETAWQDVKTTQKLIKSVHDMGFNTLRIPVTWGKMIDDEKGYSIDWEWLRRVSQIVDYAFNEGMYVIINIHHDGAGRQGSEEEFYWLGTYLDDVDALHEKFGAVWRQIANYFKDYDEHLIFESMNEVPGDEDSIYYLNQIFVNEVRATGGNNARRWLSIPGSSANIASVRKDFKFPEDTAKNRQFFAVHYYDWYFGLEESMDKTSFVQKEALQMERNLIYLEMFYTSQGIPVIMGEYGCIDKRNTVERAYFNEVMARICQNMGIVPVYWDNGYHNAEAEPADYGFSLFNRETGEVWYPEIIAAIMRGNYIKGSVRSIEKDPELIPYTAIVPEEKKITLKQGASERIAIATEPESSNDVVIWKSDDETIATVFNGMITAVEAGKTEITAYSQSGTAQSKITVLVKDIHLKDKMIKTIGGTVSLLAAGAVIIAVTLKRKKQRKN